MFMNSMAASLQNGRPNIFGCQYLYLFKYFNKIKNILQTPIAAIFKNSYFNRYMCQPCLLLEGKDYKNIP